MGKIKLKHDFEYSEPKTIPIIGWIIRYLSESHEYYQCKKCNAIWCKPHNEYIGKATDNCLN